MNASNIKTGQMSEELMGKIALALFFDKIEKDGGLRVGINSRREIGEMAKRINVPVDELDVFFEQVLLRLIGKMFGMQHVSLTMSDPVKIKFGVSPAGKDQSGR